MLQRPRALLATFALLIAAPFCSAQQSMDNAAVIKLVNSGLSESLIVQTITASPGHYDTSTDALIALKKAGVTDKEVGAMLVRNSGPAAPAAAPQQIVVMAPTGPTLPPGIDEIGVYLKDSKNGYQTVYAENVNFKTGGFLKSLATDGIVKGDINGHLTGAASKLRVSQPVQFAIYVIEGQSPGEYQLLHLHVHSDGREFRSMTGGVIHQSSGAERDTIDYTTNKITARVYEVTLPEHLPPGEYGFLPPTNMNSGRNLASSGKMFTFSIVE
jgi:hypothetical protein